MIGPHICRIVCVRLLEDPLFSEQIVNGRAFG